MEGIDGWKVSESAVPTRLLPAGTVDYSHDFPEPRVACMPNPCPHSLEMIEGQSPSHPKWIERPNARPASFRSRRAAAPHRLAGRREAHYAGAMAGALTGIRIVELAGIGPAPFAE
jgi:hypothetical protein